MKNTNKILIFLLLISISTLAFAKERVDFIKSGNSFYFFKSSGKTIFIKENDSQYESTYIDISINSQSNIKYRLLNDYFYLYIKTDGSKQIYKLNDKRWEKIARIKYTYKDIGLLNRVKIKKYQNNIRDSKFAGIEKNTIISGKIRYILPEEFDNFYMEKDKIYTLNYHNKSLIIKEFKVKAGLPYPPLDVVGTFEHNYSLYSEEYLNKIKWAPNPMNSSILNYYIYKRDATVSGSNFVFETKIPPKTYFYFDRELKIEDKNRFVYGVSVVDITLGESDIITTTGNIIKPTIGPIKTYYFNN
jgi:hypothetical protein